MLYIGVDLGTSAVKLLLMDEKGEIKKIVSREYPLYFPHPVSYTHLDVYTRQALQLHQRMKLIKTRMKFLN